MQLPARLYKRDPRANKGDFGHVFVLAGSKRFLGAACLCSLSALKAGAGLVTLGLPKSLHPIAASKLTEVMTLPLAETGHASLAEGAFTEIKEFLKKADCLLIGPGVSSDVHTQRLVRRVLQFCDKPIVADADALNALVGHLDILKRLKNYCILTPHPGEMARLLGITVREVQGSRKKVAKDFALRYNTILILKGHGTVIASPQGNVFVNNTGNPGMATAGSGDVLAGIVASFVAQGIESYEAARSGVYVHGLAGDLAARDKTEISIIASDIIDYLPKAFKKAQSLRCKAQS